MVRFLVVVVAAVQVAQGCPVMNGDAYKELVNNREVLSQASERGDSDGQIEGAVDLLSQWIKTHKQKTLQQSKDAFWQTYKISRESLNPYSPPFYQSLSGYRIAMAIHKWQSGELRQSRSLLHHAQNMLEDPRNEQERSIDGTGVACRKYLLSLIQVILDEQDQKKDGEAERQQQEIILRRIGKFASRPCTSFSSKELAHVQQSLHKMSFYNHQQFKRGYEEAGSPDLTDEEGERDLRCMEAAATFIKDIVPEEQEEVAMLVELPLVTIVPSAVSQCDSHSGKRNGDAEGGC